MPLRPGVALPGRSAAAAIADAARPGLAPSDTFTACEQRIERGPRGIPTVAIVGASYTSGVGPDNPALAWAAVLARTLRWNAVIYGVPGAGYVSGGAGGLGPMRRMLKAERLAAITPALVIVQAGHNDSGVPPRILRHHVRRTIDLIRARAPHARIALITVFVSPGRSVPRAFYRADHEIVTAGRGADRKVIIMDPLTGQWKFPHAHGTLHPTAAGDAWIARKVGAILRVHGIDARPPSPAIGPVICDLAIRGRGTGSVTSA